MLGTIVEIGARGPHASIGIEAAFREIDTVHRLMSFHESSSDVSRINRTSSGTIVHIDRRTHEVLACAQLMSHLSAGAFDVRAFAGSQTARRIGESIWARISRQRAGVSP